VAPKNPFTSASGSGNGPAAEDAAPLPSVKDARSKTVGPGSPGADGTARSSVPLFGGYRGGRKRKDGRAPGSTDAVRADKDRDAERKRMERAEAAALHDSPALPAGPAIVHALPAQTIPVVGLPGPEPFAPQPEVRWEAKDVEKLVRQFVALTEELCTKSITGRCQKANLSAAIVKEIENDAAWSASAKKMIEEGGSELAAKYLNDSGISPELKPFILISIGGLEIAINHQKVLKRLDQIISSKKSKIES
jgi:hypothetical protein